MPRITFTADHIYETHGPKKGPKFSEGEVVDCTPDFADRTAGLGVAEITGKGDPKPGDHRFTRIKGTKPNSDYKPHKEPGPAVEAAGAADEPAAAGGAAS